MYACLPESINFFIKPYILFLYASVTAKVSIFCLPGGKESITDISKSPYKISASVRGIGVAVITST